jgi:hypothetical protein
MMRAWHGDRTARRSSMGSSGGTKARGWMMSDTSCMHWGVNWLGAVQGTAVPREMVPVVPSRLRSGLQTRLGIERRHALPAVLCRDEAFLHLLGCKAPPHGRGARPSPACSGTCGTWRPGSTG